MRAITRTALVASAVFAVPGLFAVSVVGLIRLLTPDPTPEGIFETMSPNGAHKALVFDFYGGGGLSPYCFSLVFVSSSNEKLDKQRDVVFGGDCDTSGRNSSYPAAMWVTDRALIVNDQISRYHQRFARRSTDYSGQIEIRYVSALQAR